MINIFYTSQFKKEYKKVKKQNKNLSKLQVTIEHLVNKEPLDPTYKDHQLIGNWKNHNECHIESDWLLIYRVSENSLYLERTGSQSELFRK